MILSSQIGLGLKISDIYIGPALPLDQSNYLQMADFCRRTVSTLWHYHSGCVVGRVVDHDLRVIGINSLRVVDGSVFGVSPGTNPQATVMRELCICFLEIGSLVLCLHFVDNNREAYYWCCSTLTGTWGCRLLEKEHGVSILVFDSAFRLLAWEDVCTPKGRIRHSSNESSE